MKNDTSKMIGNTDKRSAIRASLNIDGKLVAKDITIPLFKREINPGKFDLIYSVRQMPQLKGRIVHVMSQRSYELGGDDPRPVGGFVAISRDDPENLLSDSDLKTWWEAYDGAGRYKEARRITFFIQTPIRRQRDISCAICGNTALHACLDDSLMLPFCSEACFEQF